MPVPWTAVLAAAACLLGAAALAVAAAGRRAARDTAERAAAEQRDALRWTSERVTDAVDRFHAAVGHLSERVAADRAAGIDAVQRSVAQQLQSLADTLATQLLLTQKQVGDGLAGATEVFGALEGRLGQVTETAVRIERLAQGVEELGRVLTVPKLRGLMGERTLETLLAELLPRRFWSVQHRFADGRTVDAVVRLGDVLLPVDAKFPLEAYRRAAAAPDDAARATARRELARAVGVRVEEIASRYVRPSEGTTDFALMFVPAEGVYAELVAGTTAELGGVLEAALARRVVPVSPATLFAYLSLVAAGVRGLAVEARARDIVRALAAAERELDGLREELAVLGRHLHNAGQRFGEVERRVERVGARVGDAARAGDEPAPSP